MQCYSLRCLTQSRAKNETQVSNKLTSDLKQRLKDEAANLGFDACGVTSATADPRDRQALERFLKAGHAGDMAWMQDGPRGAVRGDPQAMVPGARTVIVLAKNYGPALDPLATLDQRGRGAISVYAQGKDYHDVLKKRLKRLARWLVAEGAPTVTPDRGTEGPMVKVFVDTAPLMEKPLAQRAGLGWQGKHSNLVSRRFGSWLFLGEILTDLLLPPDLPEVDHCGRCNACRDVCPTNAIPEPYRVDATKCISYLTIEHKRAIEPALMAQMGNHVYGCDDCLAVCPWNKFAEPTDEAAFQQLDGLPAPRLAALARLDDASFRKMFAGSPIKRTGRDRFIRNVLIAIGNSEDAGLLPVAKAMAHDAAPLVAETAAWAAERLSQLEPTGGD